MTNITQEGKKSMELISLIIYLLIFFALGYMSAVFYMLSISKKIAHRIVDRVEEKIIANEELERDHANSFKEFETDVPYN